MKAIEQAEKQIADAFRPERRIRTSLLNNGHKIKYLVESGRYDFYDACNALLTNAKQVEEAFMWLQDDNSRMNVEYDTYVHGLDPDDYMMLGWINEQEANKIISTEAA